MGATWGHLQIYGAGSREGTRGTQRVRFLKRFWYQNKPQNGPKIGPTNCVKFGSIFVFFLWSFGALQVPLGSSLGPFDAFLDGLGPPQNIEKT